MKKKGTCLFFASLLFTCLVLAGCSFTVGFGNEVAPTAVASLTAVVSPTTGASPKPVPDYKLVVQNGDASLSTFIANAQDEFALVYPQLVTRWAADPRTVPHEIHLQFVKNAGFAAAAVGGGTIQVDIDYAHSSPYDPGVLTHELTHVVQAYPTYVVWLTEAIANYSSQLYGPRREDVFRSASRYLPNTTYTSDPYDTGSRFLFWLAQNKRADIVDQLNRILQADKYTPQDFVQLTGETLDQLWTEYQAAGAKIFTTQDEDPTQIYQNVRALTPSLVTAITPGDAANWEIDQGQGVSCGFKNNVYQVSSTTTGTLKSCKGLNAVGHNFAYQADMTILQGNTGGLLGRSDGASDLYFRVSSDGTCDLVSGHTTLLPRNASAAIKQGRQKNTLLLVVEDQNIYLYVNGSYLGSASDTTTGGGYFGFVAFDSGQSTSVNYQNVRLWQW